ncbi:hypothetical protein [Pontibacter litorisediminis]|uniref:hypothetical protein n=1 Tax=Pontibacter litorisediminis TaxID=1846260 RepID=UPI0023ED9EB8|nr:hypothetical protein [Pontibacter litorisediminis]
MKSYNLFFLLLLFVGSTSTVLAQEQEEEEQGFHQLIQEFLFSEAVYLQERREVQATLSYYRTEADIQVGNSLSLDLEYGLRDWIQLSTELENNLLRGSDRDYTLRRLESGIMIRIFNSPQQAATFALDVEFPLNKPDTEIAGAEEDALSYSPALIYARQFGQTQLHLSGGTELQAGEANWFYNAAAVYGAGCWHPLLEVAGTYQEKADWYVGTGIDINHLSGWEFIAGVRRSLNHPDWDASVRVLYEFTLGKD